MTHVLGIIVFGLLIVLGLIVQLNRVFKRRGRDYGEIIEPMLNSRDLRFISSTTAKLFHTGPFPKVEFSIGRPQTRTPVGSGEYVEYRIVTFTDRLGNEHKAWVKLDFEMFGFSGAEWRPNLREFGASDDGT